MSSSRDESKALLKTRVCKQVWSYTEGTKYSALAIEGGGSKGIAYAGVVRRLEEKDIMKDIKKFAGTSAGAQVALYLATGHTSKELSEINANMDWDRVFDMPKYCCTTLRSLHRVTTKLAVCSGYLGDHLEEIVRKKTGKEKLTFQRLYDDYGVELKVGVSNLTKQKFEMLSKDTSPNMPVALAAMASSTLPAIFPPVFYDGNTYCDGGCCGNLPTRAWPKDVTLAFHLHPDEPTPDPAAPADSGKIEGIGAYLGAIITTMWRGAQAAGGTTEEEENFRDHAKMLHNQLKVDMVHVDCGDCGAVETDMPDDRREGIEQRGYDSMDDFLKGRTR